MRITALPTPFHRASNNRPPEISQTGAKSLGRLSPMKGLAGRRLEDAS